ncbi:hypothetical protein O9X98_13880 [Agrobacterium salinitolerans]|nr:hypothetical protein [Agrobacterium salinitolerans]
MRNSQSNEIVQAIEGTEAFTPSRLVDIASRWERVMQDKRDDSTAHSDISPSFAYHRKRQALGIAEYMQRHGIEERRNIGCFQLDFVNPGDTVRLRKGLQFGTTHPSVKGPVKRNRTVEVHHTYEGYTSDLEHGRKAVVCNPRVEWVGTGGYWCWADIDDIEIVA